MKSFAFAAMATSVLGAALEARASLPAITVKGNAFFTGTDRFYIRGVDYQPGMLPPSLLHGHH
jgi:hypothetical protein